MPMRGLIALVEKEVERLQDHVEPARQFWPGWNIERDRSLADLAPGAHESFCNRRGGSEKSRRNLLTYRNRIAP